MALWQACGHKYASRARARINVRGGNGPWKATLRRLCNLLLDELSSPSVSPPPAQTTPSRSSRLKITLKLPTQNQKPSRAPRAVRKDKDLDSDIESEHDNEDDHPCDEDGKRPLTTRQAPPASVVGSSHASLDETLRKKKQLDEAKIMLWREEMAHK